MVVMQPISGGFSALLAPRSPSLAVPGAHAAIARARAAAGAPLIAQSIRGLGDGSTPAIPDWAIWAAGGLAAGAVAGFVLWKRKG